MVENKLGVTPLPGSFILQTQPFRDGCVIHYETFGRTPDNPFTTLWSSSSNPFNLGRTATHEVGHWLNLFHIWGKFMSGVLVCTDGDQVGDTPNQAVPYSGCPSHPQTSCLSKDMFMNYMDFTDDVCMNLFTKGQRDRMWSLFGTGGFRESILSSHGARPISQITTLTQVSTGSVYLNWTYLQDIPFHLILLFV